MYMCACARIYILYTVELSFPSENDLSAYNKVLLVRVPRLIPAAAED
jgi:hypothetical protein